MNKIFAVGSCLISANAMQATHQVSAPDAAGMSMPQLKNG